MERLTAELALRIALAARALDNVDTPQLLRALIATVGEPLCERRLLRLRASKLRAQLGQVNEREFQRAWGLLKKPQFTAEVQAAPDPEDAPTESNVVTCAVRIACASDGGERVDGSFSACARFLVYEVSPGSIRLVDVRPAHTRAQGDDRYAQRARLIEDCQLLYTVSIGGVAAARVVRAGIHPVKLGQPALARNVARDLQKVLSGTPPPWLAKIMGAAPAERIRFHAEVSS
jgi:nitrogen fixation protein NifX